jgi:hypothetical protein
MFNPRRKTDDLTRKGWVQFLVCQKLQERFLRCGLHLQYDDVCNQVAWISHLSDRNTFFTFYYGQEGCYPYPTTEDFSKCSGFIEKSDQINFYKHTPIGWIKGKHKGDIW